MNNKQFTKKCFYHLSELLVIYQNKSEERQIRRRQ